MKVLNFKSILVLLAAIPVLMFSSCDEDTVVTDPADDFQPVLNENFSFTVDGNTVSFATTISGNVWVSASGVDYAMVDQKVDVGLPNKGTYSFTCGSLGSGETLLSDPFDVVIEEDDLAFLDQGLWKYLSGGANQIKTWRMDMNEEADLAWFDGPVFYSGDTDPYWAWDVTDEVSGENPYTHTFTDGTTKEFTSIFNWSPGYADNTWLMAAKNYGTITFDATNGTVSTSKFGEVIEGTFTFDTTTLKMSFGGDIIIPIDTTRLNEPQFKAEDLANLRIFSLTDSAMQIGVKRSYEGFEDDEVTQKEDKWTLVYNFIVDDYTYLPEEFTYSEPVNSSFTATDLVGTWNYDAIAQDWIGWDAVGTKGTIIDAARLNEWSNREELVTAIASWDTNADEAAVKAVFDAADANSFVFNDNGTCTLAGIENTYTVADGVITFGTELSTEFQLYWIGLAGAEVTVLDFTGAEGLWLGQQNGDKAESAAIHLVKQQ
ncbi:MAG: hypothetical protein OCD76_00510 [Reichenbachiella sp.]